jgi:peptidoglycan/LPS O-acetylase OafA/YrhL
MAKLRRPLIAVGFVSLGGLLSLATFEGSAWMVSHYFWVDLVFGMGVACLMAVMFDGGFPPLRGALASRIGVTLGLFSYSIYLLHGPLVGLLDQEVFRPMHLAPLVAFGLLLVVGVPVIVVIC